MSVLTETYAAAETKEFIKPGTFFKLFRTTYPVTVLFYRGGQALAEDAVDVEAGFGVTIPGGFDRFTITTVNAQTVSAFISRGNVNYDRTVGDVSVIDGGKSDTLAGAAFFGFASKGAAGAGQYSHIQLFNPVASTKRVILTAWLANVLSASNGSMYLTFYNTALGTLVGNGKSKYSGGADSVAELRTGSDVGGLGTQIFTKSGQGICAIDMSNWKQPIVLPPGKGLCAFWDVSNISISSSPEWKEEANA